MMNAEDLEDIIKSLIKTKKEDDYWDFKRIPHDNKASLLHDIICLANSLHRGDRYLIIGVSDPNDGAKIVGLEQYEVNRMKQSHFIDFLRNKKFAGEVRPVIELHTLKIEAKEVDVLIISDRPNKPYYLTEEFRDKGKVVKENHIYTRVGDTNTPIDKSADIGFVEKMWKQRFGLDLSPLEKMKHLLFKPERWMKDIDNKFYAYNIESPEFHIDFSRPKCMDRPEPYCFFYHNDSGSFGVARFKYHSTVLFELDYIYCDGTRKMLAVPENSNIAQPHKGNSFCYYYYNMNSLLGLFSYFLTDKTLDFTSRGVGAPFICFENETQRLKFESHLSDSVTEIEAMPAPSYVQAIDRRLCEMKFNSSTSAVLAYKVWEIFKDWSQRL
ncbi:MAG: ATP-binding protein [Prevotella sp.]|nr:ATP-binding protein [Prevotella sp.]